MSKGDRHTGRRTKALGKWERLILLEARNRELDEAVGDHDKRVLWSAFLTRHGGDLAGKDGVERVTAKAIEDPLKAALNRLATADPVLVAVMPPRVPGARAWKAKSFTLTRRGRERADELLAHGGVTKAAADRRARQERHANDSIRRTLAYWHKERARMQVDVDADWSLLRALEDHFGGDPEPPLGGGTPVEEAAKRYLRAGWAKVMQRVSPGLLEAADAAQLEVDAFGQRLLEMADAAQRFVEKYALGEDLD